MESEKREKQFNKVEAMRNELKEILLLGKKF